VLLSCTPAYPQATTESSTKLEAFAAQDGSVVIKGYAEIGEVGGAFGHVTVQALVLHNAATGAKQHGITIDVKEGGRLEREDRTFLDYDEIDSLIKGIDYLSRLQNGVTELDNFEADYRTRGDLRIATFSSTSGIRASIAAGRVSAVRAFLSLDELSKFRTLIVSAKTKLDGLKGA
jgi:hypothetical protein